MEELYLGYDYWSGNKIVKIENLDKLQSLKILSLGNQFLIIDSNQIKCVENLLVLKGLNNVDLSNIMID